MSILHKIRTMLSEDGRDSEFLGYLEFSKEFPLDVWVEHGPGSRSKKIYEDQNKLMILGLFAPGVCYDTHHHDCRETVQVLSGVFIDQISGIKKIQGQSISWGRGVKHKPATNSVGCLIVVTFDLYRPWGENDTLKPLL